MNALSGGAERCPPCTTSAWSCSATSDAQRWSPFSYAGSMGRNFLYVRNYNPEPLGARASLTQNPGNKDPTTTNSALPPNFLRPYMGFGDINAFEFSATSNYNSLQSSFSQRLNGRMKPRRSLYVSAKCWGVRIRTLLLAVDPFPQSAAIAITVRLGFDRTHVFFIALQLQHSRARGRDLHFPAGALDRRRMGSFPESRGFSPADRSPPGYSLVAGNGHQPDPLLKARAIQVIDPAAAPLQMFGPPKVGNARQTRDSNILRGPGMNNWDVSMNRKHSH